METMVAAYALPSEHDGPLHAKADAVQMVIAGLLVAGFVAFLTVPDSFLGYGDPQAAKAARQALCAGRMPGMVPGMGNKVC